MRYKFLTPNNQHPAPSSITQLACREDAGEKDHTTVYVYTVPVMPSMLEENYFKQIENLSELVGWVFRFSKDCYSVVQTILVFELFSLSLVLLQPDFKFPIEG